MAKKPGVSIDLTGPLFQRDPAKTVKQNIARMMVGLAQEGERAVKSGWTNSTKGREGVVGRAHAITGKPWSLHATITPGFKYPWANSGQKAYRGGRDKVRNRAFRSTTYRLRSARFVLGANLVKGLDS